MRIVQGKTDARPFVRVELTNNNLEILRAGATVTKPAGPTFWGGYAGYFQDPDGHLWEVAFNAALLPPD